MTENATRKPHFDKTYCSQCGAEFGPGDHGFSSCKSHRGLQQSANYPSFQELARRRGELPRIVCLCGSTRFIREMACIMWALERDEGYITIGMHLLPDNYPGVQADHMAEHEGFKEHFDELHKRKIDLADEILVINIGGYIGESTRSEIKYARAHGKPVRFIEKEI